METDSEFAVGNLHRFCKIFDLHKFVVFLKNWTILNNLQKLFRYLNIFFAVQEFL